MDGFNNAGMLAQCEKASIEDRAPTAREQLARKKTQMERQLTEVNAALAALDEHPEIEKVLTLVGRAARY